MRNINNFSYKKYLQYKRIKRFQPILCEASAIYDYGQNKIIRYHDKIFKNLLSNKKEAVRFINKNLKIEGSENELLEKDVEKCNTQFLTKEKEKLEADILYRVKGKQVYILIEQQSTVDYSMPKRILEYCVEVMREVEKNENIDYRTDKLPVIYPIVLYTGKTKWLAKMELTQMQDELEEVKKMVMSSYILVDVHNYTKEELIKERSSIAKAMLIEKIQSEDELIEVLEAIVEESLNTEEKTFVLDLLENTIQDRIGKNKSEQLVEKILGKGGESMVYEHARELFNKWYDKAEKTGYENGMKRGISDGMQQGMQQAMKQVAIQMIKNKMSDNTIKKITKMTNEELDELKRELSAVNI